MRTPLMLLTCLRATAAVVAVEDLSVAVLCHPFVNPACPEGETIVSIKCIRYCFSNINTATPVNHAVHKSTKKSFHGQCLPESV